MSLFPLLIAIQFLTRLPVKLTRVPEPKENGQSLLWYPAVGLALGALLVLVQGVISDVSPLLQAALLLTLWVWMSGGLHMDGLADTADAWVGGHGDRERTLEIMKDPGCGPIGVLSLVLVLLLKFAALVSLITVDQWLALLLAPWLGRWMLPTLLLTTPYARPNGMGRVLVDNIPSFWLPAILILNLLAMFVFGRVVFFAVLCGCAFAFYWRRVLQRRLGGTTGDTAGALLEITECVVLVVIALASTTRTLY